MIKLRWLKHLLIFFVNVAKDIGKDSCAVNQEHPSVKVISEHNYSENKLNLLTSIDISFLEKQIDKINVNKATGKDGISVKILKIAKQIVSKPITMLIYKTTENTSFPSKLKEAQVVPLHKKNSQLEVGNYRPVGILPVVSKFFERAIYEQLSHYIENIGKKPLIVISIQLQCLWISRRPLTAYLVIF